MRKVLVVASACFVASACAKDDPGACEGCTLPDAFAPPPPTFPCGPPFQGITELSGVRFSLWFNVVPLNDCQSGYPGCMYQYEAFIHVYSEQGLFLKNAQWGVWKFSGEFFPVGGQDMINLPAYTSGSWLGWSWGWSELYHNMYTFGDVGSCELVGAYQPQLPITPTVH